MSDDGPGNSLMEHGPTHGCLGECYLYCPECVRHVAEVTGLVAESVGDAR